MKLLLLIAALLVGGWLGMNIAYEQPLFSNPFEEQEAADRLRRAADEATAAAREIYQETREELRESLNHGR